MKTRLRCGQDGERDSTPSPVPLGECATILPGQHILESAYNRKRDGIGYLTGPADFGEVRPIIQRWTNSPKVFAMPGDVLITVKGAGVGKANLAPNERVAIGRQLMAIRPTADLSQPYLYYFLRHVFLDFQRAALGATVPGLDRNDVESLCIPLPATSEQERIARRLTEQLASVERARAAAAERLAVAQALPAAYLREVFEGVEAKKWETRRLGDLLRRHNQIVHPGDRQDGEATFVGLEHIEPHTGRRIGSLKIDLGKLTGRKPTFLRGQIVYGYLRPYLNKVWVADFDGCSSVDQFAFEVNQNRADTEFVAAFMRSAAFLRRVAGATTPGQLPRISVDQIAAVTIELPSNVTAQRRIAADLSRRLAEAERLAGSLRDELAAIDALPAAILREAFGDSNDASAEDAK